MTSVFSWQNSVKMLLTLKKKKKEKTNFKSVLETIVDLET